jgi:predicted ATPase
MNEFAQTQPLTDPSNIEPVIAGTLVLMTQFQIQRRACMIAKIGSNLELLANCPHLSPPFRTLCERLQQQWMESLQESQLGFTELQRQGAALH